MLKIYIANLGKYNEGENANNYSVFLPDLPGCVASGNNFTKQYYTQKKR